MVSSAQNLGIYLCVAVVCIKHIHDHDEKNILHLPVPHKFWCSCLSRRIPPFIFFTYALLVLVLVVFLDVFVI